MTEIYSAGEDKIPGIEASRLADAIRSHGHRQMHFVSNLDDVLDRLVAEARPGDLVITLGAGTISSLSARVVERLREGRG